MSVTEKGKKGKVGRVLRIYRRAFGMLRREFGGYMTAEIMRWMLMCCSPYWGIWFSARLLDEILGDSTPRTLILYAALLLGGNLILDFGQTLFSVLSDHRKYEFSEKQNMIFARKMMELDYSLLEEEKIHTLLNRVVRESYYEG